MLKIKSSRMGVSPVIATILMVAITVVLAAVLYVLIIGLSTGSGELAPLGSWQAPEKNSNTSISYVFGAFSSEVKVIDMKIILEQDGNQTFIEFPGSLLSEMTAMSITGAGAGEITAGYEDNSWATSNVNQGDKIHFYGLEPGGTYEIKVFHIPTGEMMSMTGYKSNFEMLP